MRIDLYKLNEDQYVAPLEPVIIETRPTLYLVIPGRGVPGGPAFTTAMESLYAVAFTVKMTRKAAGLEEYAVGKLEATFPDNLAKTPREQWRWNLMIRTPQFVAETDRQDAASQLLKKGKPREVETVKLRTLDEGLCVQMLHVGPYERERETTELMRAFAASNNLKFCGPHHEIYLSDPRRSAPEGLQTILRQPVTK